MVWITSEKDGKPWFAWFDKINGKLVEAKDKPLKGTCKYVDMVCDECQRIFVKGATIVKSQSKSKPNKKWYCRSCLDMNHKKFDMSM